MKPLLCALVLLLAASRVAAAPQITPAQIDARAHVLEQQLRCVVCQGESLDESSAPLAADLRNLIRAHIAAGESDVQIKTYLVQRYGNFILMQPPVGPSTYLLWLGPFTVLLIGGAIATVVIGRAGKSDAI